MSRFLSVDLSEFLNIRRYSRWRQNSLDEQNSPIPSADSYPTYDLVSFLFSKLSQQLKFVMSCGAQVGVHQLIVLFPNITCQRVEGVLDSAEPVLVTSR